MEIWLFGLNDHRSNWMGRKIAHGNWVVVGSQNIGYRVIYICLSCDELSDISVSRFR